MHSRKIYAFRNLCKIYATVWEFIKNLQCIFCNFLAQWSILLMDPAISIVMFKLGRADDAAAWVIPWPLYIFKFTISLPLHSAYLTRTNTARTRPGEYIALQQQEAARAVPLPCLPASATLNFFIIQAICFSSALFHHLCNAVPWPPAPETWRNE